MGPKQIVVQSTDPGLPRYAPSRGVWERPATQGYGLSSRYAGNLGTHDSSQSWRPGGESRLPPPFERVHTRRHPRPCLRERDSAVWCADVVLAAGAAAAGTAAAISALAAVIARGIVLSTSANARERRDEPADLGAATVPAHDRIRHSALRDEQFKFPRTLFTRVFVDRHVDLLILDVVGLHCGHDCYPRDLH